MNMCAFLQICAQLTHCQSLMQEFAHFNGKGKRASDAAFDAQPLLTPMPARSEVRTRAP
jgi:hypothetical protein